MKKEIRRTLVAMMVIMATVLSFVACDGKFEESLYVKGDRVEIIKGDTIYVRDTAYVEKIIEIITDKTERFICYDFKKNGNILGHVMNHAYTREFSYTFQMESVKEIFFTKEQEIASFSVTAEATFDEKSMAFLNVNNGAEEISVPVIVPGSHSVKIDNEDLFPCNEFTLTAEVKKEEKTKVIKEKEYEVAVVTYKFLNGLGEEVKSSEMTLYSPIKEINERTIDLSYEVIENEVVITGKIENTIDPDTTIITKVPLALSLSTEEKKVVNGSNFDFSADGNPSDTLKTVIKNLTEKKDSLTVTYNEIEGVYTHNVTASGNTVTVKQTARYYNEFVATLYGETLEINLPVEVKTKDYEKVSENETASEKSQLYNIDYTASQSSLTASATQEVEIVVAKANEKTITLSYEDVNGELIVTGLVDNSINADEEFSVKISRILSISTEERKVVNGQNFTLSVGANPSEVSKEIVNNLSKVDGSLTVTYNEYSADYSHTVTASGNNVELKQNVKYYNTFVAELYGETLDINLPVEVKTKDYEKVSENETASEKSQLYNVNYTASQSSLSASATQEVEIVIARSSFEGETVLYANRTVTFDKLQSPKVYDCVVTSTSVGGHNFKYREVYADGSKSAWTSEALSDANFKFIEEGMKNSNAALAIYNHKNVEGSRVGYLRDFLSTAGQIIYFSYDCPQSTFDSVNATMFGQLDDCILGTAKTVEGSIEMSCIAGVYNDNIISPAEKIYF